MIRLRPAIAVARVRVGSVTSASEAINKINAFVAEASPKHDLSTESWRAVWVANFGVHTDGVSPGWANKGGIASLLDRLDACAPGYSGCNGPGLPNCCDKAADMVFDGVNSELGLPADNGWITFQQLMTWLGRYPVNADDPAGEGGGFLYVPSPSPSPPILVSKEAVEHPPFLVSPEVSSSKSSPLAPILLGAVATTGLYFLAGLSLLVSAIPLAAAGAYVVATRKS
jgi:hypothetical protein